MHLKNIIKTVLFAFIITMMPIAGSMPAGLGGITQAEAAVVSNIQVRGNKRMENDTVISFLTIVPGERFNNFDIDESIKALFATGLFNDVSIFQQGSTLIVDVDENATVNKVFFEGNSRIKDEGLEPNVQLRARSIYSDEKAASDVDLIRQAYSQVGREDTTVSYEVVPLANNRVNVVYRIDEGEKTKIKQINFVGNQTFTGRRLLDVVSTKESTLLSFLSTSDIYDQNRLNADEELLRRFYFNKGFADFQVISTTADLDSEENEYIITFTIEEGARYNFGDIQIESTIPDVTSERLAHLLETVPGEHYSAKKVEDTIVSITESVAEEGYAFVEVVPRGNRNFDTNTIDVVYLVDEGARVFIEDIQILGNDRTRDYVIRREFDLSEGDAYNRVLVQKTRQRLEGLGYFESVDISTRPGSEPDRVILYVRVAEQSTGDISLSGGYSSNGGAGAEVSFTERNFLGRGQFLRASFRSGDEDSAFRFQFTEPYFLGYRVSAGINIFSTETDDTDERQYSIDEDGVTLTFGIPITEKLGSSVFYSYRDSDLSVASSFIDSAVLGPVSITTPDGRQGNRDAEISNAIFQDIGGWKASGFGYSFTYSDLDNVQNPRDGLRAQFSQTIYGAGGDAQYFATEAAVNAFKTVSEEADLVFLGSLKGGHIQPFSGDDGVRVVDNFQATSRNIRGFNSLGYGPRDPLTRDPLGGRSYWAATAELQFPLPFTPQSFGLRGAVFVDAGMLFNPGNDAIAAVQTATGTTDINQLDDDNLRASIGGSILWASPFGPLRIDYAVPLEDQPFDDLQEFNFGVSSRF